MTGGLLLLILLVMVAVEAKERAILEIVLYEQELNGDVKTYEVQLSGHFTNAGARSSAEGQIVQIHPMGLCNNGDFEESIGSHTDYGWVVVVKLELPQLNAKPCMSVYDKAKRAIQRGATAVVFDVTDNQRAAKQLRTAAGPALPRPVVIVRGKEADKLMNIVNTQKQARARIKSLSSDTLATSNTKEFFNMGIFLSFFVLFCIVCLTVILKLKWRQRARQLSPTEIAKRTLAKLETRRYKEPASRQKHRPTSLCSETDSCADTCAVCLEEYRDTQDIRILPCSHEFHRSCVDPWLISNRTCPLCLYNILECPADNQDSPCSTPDPNHHGNAAIAQTHPHIINNNFGHLNNLNMASVTMSTPRTSSNLVYPSSSHAGYDQYDAHRVLPTDRYYSVQQGRYQTFGQYTGLEYNQIETIPMSTSFAFNSHGNPPHYGLPLYSAYHPPPTFAESECGTVKISSPRTTKSKLVTVPGKRTGTASKKYNIASGSGVSRKATEVNGSNRITRPGRAHPVVPVNHYTSSESDIDLYHHPIPPTTHQVILHQQQQQPQQKKVVGVPPPVLRDREAAESDSDTCSCGAMSNGSNIDCSNRSTLGSSDLPSDVSSFDSNAYRCRTPDEQVAPNASIVAAVAAAPITVPDLQKPPKLPPSHLNSACVSNRNRIKTHYSLKRKKSELNSRQGNSARHSCHGDVYKHGSVEAMLPPMLKSKQSNKKTNIVYHIALSSDNSVSSLDTTGMSPVVSDWCVSSGSETNEQICDDCQKEKLSTPTQSLGVRGPSQVESERCSGHEADASGCYQSDTDTGADTDHSIITKSEVLPCNSVSGVYTNRKRTKAKFFNIPTKTYNSSHNQHNPKTKISEISNLDSMHSKLVANANAVKRLHKTSAPSSKRTESHPKVIESASPKFGQDFEGHKHGTHAPAAVLATHGCHTCATLRSSLKMVRASMFHSDHDHNHDHDHDHRHLKSSPAVSVNRVTTSSHVTTGATTVSTTISTSPAILSQGSHVPRRHHRTSRNTLSLTDATKDGIIRRPSLVIFTEQEGTHITLPKDSKQDMGCLSVV